MPESVPGEKRTGLSKREKYWWMALEADLADGKVAYDSPLGLALMHQHVGAQVTVVAPAGNYQVVILAIR